MSGGGEERLLQLDNAWAELVAGQAPDIDAERREQMRRVWAGSDFVAQLSLRHPTRLLELMQSGLLDRSYAAGEMGGRLAAQLADVDSETALEQALRVFRNSEMLRIIWRDLCNLAGLDETLEDLSELADVCIRESLRLLTGWAAQTYGRPRDATGQEQTLVVLGMGKLGARELNLSSDIDLIFCFPSRGSTDGRKSIDNEQFFVKVGRKLINALSRQTAEGFVFRVDMRLRPFGDSGPLVVNYDAMETYYESQAREWERYAMVKARPLTGTADEVQPLVALLKAFVYRRYIDFGAIEAIRELKVMIERELQAKGMDADIKLGRGGIREIEFIGQAFQLVRGGRERDLQVRPILLVLSRLGDLDLLPPHAVGELQTAYRFLRRTENRIQAWQDRQTHLLPDTVDDRRRLAVAMGYREWAHFSADLELHRQRVHEHFSCVFEAPQGGETGDHDALAACWLAEPEDAVAQGAMQQAGFADAPLALQRLLAFRSASAVRTLSARGRDMLDRLMPLLLNAISQAEAPDLALDRLLRLLEAIVKRTSYINLLFENPLALSQLVRLVGESSWVGSQLASQPLLLDELLDPRRLYSPLHTRDLDDELGTLLGQVDENDLEQIMERLRQFAQGNRLRVAAADIVGAIPLMVVSDYLTEIAEVTLQQVQRSAWRDLTARHGRPGGIKGGGSGFALIGYGKLGGIELGYGSDLDMVFLHGSESTRAVTDGRKEVANEVFYARLGQRIIHMLTTRMPSGQLYEVDMRLRPNGNSGLLVTSLGAFERYQDEDAWTWEHQALVRARAVSGDPVVIERFNGIRDRILRKRRDPGQLRKDVCGMREKMRNTLDRSNSDQFDIKQGQGGLVDIEFVVQFAVLRWAHEHPGLTRWTDNIRLLERLTEYGLLAGHSAELLANAYRVLRTVVHRKTLQEADSVIGIDELSEERAMVSEIREQVLGCD